MTAKVPTIENGSARLGMTVADRLRRNRKITMTTRASVRSSVNLTSLTESWIDTDRSNRTFRDTEDGSSLRKVGSKARTARAISTVFVPGCLCTARMIPRVIASDVQYQAAVLSFSTLSITLPSSRRRTGEPSRYATMSGRYSAASVSWPLASRSEEHTSELQ